MTVSNVPEASSMVTTSSKVVYLRGLFKGHLRHDDQLMTPLSEWYSHNLSIETLEDVAKQLCQWMSIKPRQLDVRFDNHMDAAGNYYEDGEGHHIVINSMYENRPYEAVAVVTHETVHYILESRKHLKTSDLTLKEELIDLATIYYGFGALLINGMNHHENWSQRWWTSIRPSKHDFYIGSYSSAEYAKQLGHYVGQSTTINNDNLVALLTPWSRRLFVNQEPYRTKPAPYVRAAIRRIRTANTVFLGCLLLASVVLGLTFFVARQIPKQTSPELIAQHEQADLLYKQYRLCTQTVNSLNANTINPDIFTQQNLNAGAVRCQSLKNQYNSAVDSYNQSLRQH